MSDQPSVFSEQDPATQPTSTENPDQQTQGASQDPPVGQQQQPAAQPDSVFEHQLASIKNERGEPKYKDLPTALEALKHSQEYIPSLKQENDALKADIERIKEELERRASVEDTVERLATQQAQTPSPQEMQGMTEEQITALLEQRLTERESKQKAEANSRTVEEALRAKYGDKAPDVVAEKAKEYEMSPAELGKWAANNPKAVMALFEVKSTPQSTKSNTSSVNIPPITPNSDESLAPPEKSLLRGASTKDQMEYFRKVKESVNKRIGVTE